MKSGRADEERFDPGALRMTRIKTIARGRRKGRMEFMSLILGLALTKDFLEDPDLYQLTSNIDSLPL